MAIGLLSLRLHIPGCESLKEKRSRLSPLLARLHKEFNISVAELDDQDTWKEATLACALVSNDAGFTQRALTQVANWVEKNWPDVEVIEDQIEIL